MKKILTILLVLFLTSCLTVKRIEKNCDKFAKVCITESTTVIDWRDTTISVHDTILVEKLIEVPIPNFADSAKISDLLKLTDSLMNNVKAKDLPLKNLTKTQGLIGISLYGKWLSIEASAYLLDSTIFYNYKDTLLYSDSIKIYNAIKETVTDNTVTLPPVRYIPKLYKICFWIVLLSVIGGVLYLVWKIYLHTIIKIPKFKK